MYKIFSTNEIIKFLVITAIGSMLIGSGVAYGFEIFKGEDNAVRSLNTAQIVKLKTFDTSDGLSAGDTVLSFKATKVTSTSSRNAIGAIYDSGNNLLGSSNVISLPRGQAVIEFTMTTPVTVPADGIVHVMMNNDGVTKWRGGGPGIMVFDQETFPIISDPWRQSTELANNGIRCTGCSIDITLVVDDTPINNAPICDTPTISDDSLWPPNHKMKSVSVAMTASDVDGDSLFISIISIFQDEAVTGIGEGTTSPDGEITGDDTADIRAERSGNENGRVYTITVQADDGNGGVCSGEVTVGVPHDKKDVAIDDGPNFDSTQE